MKWKYFLWIALFFLACNNASDTDKYTDSTHHKSTHDHEGHKHHEHDHSGHDQDAGATAQNNKPVGDYSPAFLQKLMMQKGQRDVTIHGEKIIFGGKDTVSFPAEPAMNEVIKVGGKNKNLRIAGTIKRINYTSVDYHMEVEDVSGNRCIYTGTADLGAGFYLASESDTDDSTGDSYFSTEFHTEDQTCQAFSLRIGKPAQPDAKYLVKIISDCSDACASIDLDNGPVLKQE